MDNYLRKKLSEQYKVQKCFSATDCLKLTYQYDGVRVALYFDEYDEIICNLFLIVTYGDCIYFTRIDMDLLATKNPYLKESPYIILGQIQKDKSLQNLYDVMRDKIQNVEFKKSSYNNQEFKQAVKMNKTGDEIFFWYLKKANMRDEYFNFLYKKLNISLKTLRAVKNQGYTMATTNDINKKITFILK